MDTRSYRVSCRSCSWSRTVPGRERAEHLKRVHEFWYDHSVALDG